ncbi:tail fiber assembly protein [Aeromonas veronii]
MKEPRVTWGEDDWAESSGWALAHCVDAVTHEYLGPEDVWVSVGTGMPAGAYIDAPPAHETGQAIVRQEDSWVLVPDYRGQTAYDTLTRQPLEVTELGPLPALYTLLAPTSPFDNWTGSEWQHDEDAEQQAILSAAQGEYTLRIADANQQIAIIKPAVDGGYAKPEHTQLLADWQRYCYEVTLVPEQANWPIDPLWPNRPEPIV